MPNHDEHKAAATAADKAMIFAAMIAIAATAIKAANYEDVTAAQAVDEATIIVKQAMIRGAEMVAAMP